VAARAARDAFAALDADIEAMQRVAKRELIQDLEQVLAGVESSELDGRAVNAALKAVKLAGDCLSPLLSAQEALDLVESVVWPPPVQPAVRPRSPGRTHRHNGTTFYTVGFLCTRLDRCARTIGRWQEQGWLPEATRRWRMVPAYRNERLWTEIELDTIVMVAEDLHLGDYQKLPARVGAELGRRCREELTRLRALERQQAG
jgi:hypothetical protein